MSDERVYETVEEKPQSTKKLLVGTIFIDDSPLQLQWFDLQRKYLSKTTDSYDHVVFCAAKTKTDVFQTYSTFITNEAARGSRQSTAHVAGLTCLLDYFRSKKDLYENFLFIDSDAFPIRKNWMEILKINIKKPHEIAICLRPENLEQRLHSSVVFAKPSALDNMTFRVARQPLNDLCGQHENDVQCHPYQTEMRDRVFPLLRSNKYQLHPLLYGVYYDMFYHNGCGSGRRFNMRARYYWKHMFSGDPDLEKNMNRLFEKPNEFIRELAGWQFDEYAEV